jgi:hypothetical protein
MAANPAAQLQAATRNYRVIRLLAFCLLTIAFEPSALPATKFAQNELIVSKEAAYPDDIWELRTTAASRVVMINNVIVNRGHCKPSVLPHPAAKLPQTLRPGESGLYSYYLCNPIEVEVVTDQGTSIYALDDEFAQGSLAATKNDSTEPGHIWELRITTRADRETIESVIANHGDCRAHTPPPLPQILTFGDTIGNFIYFCNPTEVQVITDHGVSIFNWSE